MHLSVNELPTIGRLVIFLLVGNGSKTTHTGTRCKHMLYSDQTSEWVFTLHPPVTGIKVSLIIPDTPSQRSLGPDSQKKNHRKNPKFIISFS